jgi:cellulose synthase/poly-beta-1,6-N-acetylglucosamine synthase-like glycosyltransferase
VIIDITRCSFERGYLPRKKNTIFHPFFATCNAAFRRDALSRAGEFDLKCRTGEDVDMSIRVAQAGYELWYEPSAKVRHLDRHTLGGMLRQWFDYGAGHPYLLRKHVAGPRLEVYRLDVSNRTTDPIGVRRLLDVRFPVPALVVGSVFHLFHLALATCLAAAWLGALTATWVAAAVALLAGGWYLSLRFDWRRPLRSLALAGLRYAADFAFVLGGLLSGLRQGALFLGVTRTRRQPPRK